MKYYIIAGEASGDLHASKLMRELKKLDNEANFRFWGGDLMAQQGGQQVMHYKQTAYMGFADVLLHVRTIKKFIQKCKADLLAYKPDVLILVDYPGFNLRIAEFAHENNIRTHYYISPKVWAWKQSRALKIKTYIEKLFVIFPFEIDFYKQYDYKVEYVGNPVVDAVDEQIFALHSDDEFRKSENLSKKPIIALLPGSRKQEIKYNLPPMLKLVAKSPDYEFVIAVAPSLDLDFVKSFCKNVNVSFVSDKTYSVLKAAKAAVVCSGTATLETALIGTPQLCCYRGEHVSYQIAKRLVKVKYISLVNLVADAPVIKEFIQYDMTDNNLSNELKALLTDSVYTQTMLAGYTKVRAVLGGQSASARTAKVIFETIKC